MNRKSTLAMLALLFCLALLSAAWVGQARAKESTYSCRCKGIENRALFVVVYEDCGNGFTGGNKGQVNNNIPASEMGHYLPSVVTSGISETKCGYYEHSGWNCGKMQKNIPPACLYE